MNATAARRPVIRWDVGDIADELEDDVADVAGLLNTGATYTGRAPADVLDSLRALVRRTWAAAAVGGAP